MPRLLNACLAGTTLTMLVAGCQFDTRAPGQPTRAELPTQPAAGSPEPSACGARLATAAASDCCRSGELPASDPRCMPACGNGVLEPGEACDPPSSCPTATRCETGNACVAGRVEGAAETCTAVCEVTEVTKCASDDGCCPSGCSHATDSDCSASCGDGVVDSGETCEPDSPDQPCPASCDDGDRCTADMTTGTLARCNVQCIQMPITRPRDADGCCPPGANANTDSDCSASCGNRAVEAGEDCDGNCPTSCDDANSCTADSVSGSARQCNVVCKHEKIAVARSGDGCCPAGANANDDSDCPPVCGNRVVEDGEICDGDCPNSCDDRNGCTSDAERGSRARCDLECDHDPITSARSGDGCCPRGANANTDSDCTPVCGNRVKEPGETCDGDCPDCKDSDACTSDKASGAPNRCNVKCENTPIMQPRNGDGCCPPIDQASSLNDDDCKPRCGNGVVEGDEMCDGNCQTREICDDQDPCTDDNKRGLRDNCHFECSHMPTGADGCPPVP